MKLFAIYMTEHNGLQTVLCSIASSCRVVKSVHPGVAIGTICEDTKKRNADRTLHPSIDFWNRIMSKMYPLWKVCMKAPVACCDENVSTWVKPQSLVNSVIAWCVICFWVWHHLVCTDLQCWESLGFVAPCVMPLMKRSSCLEVTQGLGLLSWSTCATIMPCSVAPRSQILFQKGLMMTRLPRGYVLRWLALFAIKRRTSSKCYVGRKGLLKGTQTPHPHALSRSSC